MCYKRENVYLLHVSQMRNCLVIYVCYIWISQLCQPNLLQKLTLISINYLHHDYHHWCIYTGRGICYNQKPLHWCIFFHYFYCSGSYFSFYNLFIIYHLELPTYIFHPYLILNNFHVCFSYRPFTQFIE